MDAIISSFYDRNTFVKRLHDHVCSQDGPIGGSPATYSDLFCGRSRDGPMGRFEDLQSRIRVGMTPVT